jgi:hypothetical protein
MDSFDKDNWPTRLVALLFVTLSVSVTPPLALYFWLNTVSLGNPDRLNPALDLYATIWSAAAIGASVYNIYLVRAVTRGRDRSALLVVGLVSVACVVSCPEWLF